jgi:2-methylisocitrate lyase-like PEP mutase family enzyme
MANSLGYSDGEAWFPPEQSLALVRRIVHAVDVPVSVDIEAGYGDPERMVREAIEAGVVGINIEDRVGDETAPRPIEEAAAKIATVRRTADELGFPLFLNARTDTLILGGDVDDAIARIETYAAAGADCGLPIGIKEPEDIRRVVESVSVPVNVNAGPGHPTIPELQELGVRRVSVTVYRAATSFIRSVAEDLLAAGTFDSIARQAPFPPLNDVFRARA